MKRTSLMLIVVLLVLTAISAMAENWIKGGSEYRKDTKIKIADWFYSTPCVKQSKNPNHMIMKILYIYTEAGRQDYSKSSNIKNTIYSIDIDLSIEKYQFLHGTDLDFNNNQPNPDGISRPFGKDSWYPMAPNIVAGDWLKVAKSCPSVWE
jgi:hypothetical protein